MRIRLTRKLAECLDGVDLSRHCVGDVLDLSDREAGLLVAERWAMPYVPAPPRRYRLVARASERSSTFARAEAADRTTRRARALEQLRHVREQMEQGRFEPQEHPGVDDRIREELHDSHARTVPHSRPRARSSRVTPKR